MRQGLLLVVVAVGVLMSCGPSDTLPTSSVGALRSNWSVVLPAAKQAELLTPCSRPVPAGLTGHWLPAQGDIERLERGLARVLENALARVILENGEARPSASDYYRQYGGFHHDGRRVVYVNGLHQRIVQMRDSPSWTAEPIGLCDGGLMGFGVVYDVGADRFGHFEFDGRFSGRVKTRWF